MYLIVGFNQSQIKADFILSLGVVITYFYEIVLEKETSGTKELLDKNMIKGFSVGRVEPLNFIR